MKIVDEYSYRNGKEILQKKEPALAKEIINILKNKNNKLNLSKRSGQSLLSSQIPGWFEKSGWVKEAPCFSISDLRYDLLKKDIPIEIEIGHQRLVYADFFEFMADYSKRKIPMAVMIVAGNPSNFGHTWHNSLHSTKKKIEAIKETFLIPLWVIAVDP